MSPALIAPASAVAAKAVHGVMSLNPTSLLAPAPTKTAGGASANFASTLGRATTVSPSGLVGMSPADLRKTISSLNPDQQTALSQQLVGADVTVQDASGRLVSGALNKLRIENGFPVFSVAGQDYSLGQLAAVNKPAYA
ncbi:hypothetical protein SAMN05444156_2857 [Verrucomicrobium sp. GAS474]|uniref:hypothetical protein n=1 Tax=Verrucomicrobium sp. GAS474 TaxID=1882831 RepID=UPI00087B5FDD|nr:hypothetical protein [Verrucomicrobium sp. GAS474]SDU25009.1 hypothetical protein SAMN05444156_2857 [Verrucomicrobium sp. GAS474]